MNRLNEIAESKVTVTYWHKEVRNGEIVMEWRQRVADKVVLDALATLSPDLSLEVNKYIMSSSLELGDSQ